MDVTEDEEWKGLETIDSESYNTGKWLLKKNNSSAYLVNVSFYQEAIHNTYLRLTDESVETVEEALKQRDTSDDNRII